MGGIGMNLGVIGFGRRIRNMIDEIVSVDPQCRIAAIADVRCEQLKTELEEEGIRGVELYDTPEAMMEAGGLDGILIGTRCSLHTEMALKVFPSRIPLFLEKPVATTMDDWTRLRQGYDAYHPQVVVSFPLRFSPLVTMVKEIIDSGKVGTVEHVQAVNNVPYGGVYYHHWYRDENETGGLFLQKATHDFDYINHLLGMKPVSVCAMVSKQIFTGTKPAGLKCVDCDEKETCPESTEHIKKKRTETPAGEFCCFAVDTGNEDSGSALVRYESGMHVSYTQNFFARHKAATRGARLLGYKGTLEFDFYTNEVKVYMHQSPEVETYRIDPDQAHFGGDAVLAKNFIDVMKGEADSGSGLREGLLSGLMCLKARESAQTNMFQAIEWTD
jgi:predicted dehydrogenase